MESVRDFWETHVNNEYYTDEERASEAYFLEIEERRYRWHYHLRELFDSLQGSQCRLLEVGSGIGVDSIQLARCGFDVTAVDLTESAIAVARQFAERRGVTIDFRVGNAERLDFPDEASTPSTPLVLHHTPDIEQAVAEVRRVLRPGGTAYVMLYHRDSLVNLVHKVLRLPYESPGIGKTTVQSSTRSAGGGQSGCSVNSQRSGSEPDTRSPSDLAPGVAASTLAAARAGPSNRLASDDHCGALTTTSRADALIEASW